MQRITLKKLRDPFINYITEFNPFFIGPEFICIINPAEKFIEIEIGLFNLDLPGFNL